jgi:tetratricopeptide (TPR) repeat protein
LLSDLASVYRKKGEYSTAYQLYSSAADVVESAYGIDHPELGEIYNNIGVLLKKQAKYSEAIPVYEKSLKIIQSIFGEQSYKYAACLNNLGDIQRKVYFNYFLCNKCFLPSSLIITFCFYLLV